MAELKMTPKDSVEALRLMTRLRLVEPGDSAEVKEQIQGVASLYLAAKRAGLTDPDVEFTEWYETADIANLEGALEGALGGGADPTE